MRGRGTRAVTLVRLSKALLCIAMAVVSYGAHADETAPAILARVEAWDRLHGDVRRNVRRYGAHRVVVAIDFDNTTARVPTYYGSDAWYRAQLARGKDKDTIHDELEQIFASTPHELVDPLAPEYLRKWQELGVQVVLLTARSPRFHAVTRKEAHRLALDFARTAPSSHWHGREVTLDVPDRKGGRRQGVVAYHHGMIYCGDVDKGTVLRSFLEAANLQPAAVVFADDREHHLAEVGHAFRDAGVDLRLIHVDDGREPKACPHELAEAGLVQ